MAKRKKSRKVGLIGVRKVPKEDRKPSLEAGSSKPKKKTGKPSGSRHSAKLDSNTQAQTTNKDPRVGSKKPIPLIVEEVKSKPKKPTYFSPAQELKAIESDTKLDNLLDMIDNDQPITREQKHYVDAKMARHKALCDLLGIEPEAEEETDNAELEDDPLARYEAIDPKKLV